MRRHRDWAGWAVDLGIVCFFVALIAMCFSRFVALSLFAAFAALTVVPMFRRPRRK